MIPWSIVAALAFAGLFVLLCGLFGRGDEGRVHVEMGIGMLGAALFVAFGKAAYMLGQIRGWWA